MSHGRLDHGVSGTPGYDPQGNAPPPGKRALTSSLVQQRRLADVGAQVVQRESLGEPAADAGGAGNGLSCEQSFVDSIVYGPVQRQADGDAGEGDVHALAAAGVAGGGEPLPFLDQIQRSFGHHDVGGVSAHTDGAAAEATAGMGAAAYATGNHVAFGRTPDLHTAAHEAAHVVQQRAGVHLKGGVGEEGDAYEQHADAVADTVVRGDSAEGLLDEMSGGEESAESEGEEEVQLKKEPRKSMGAKRGTGRGDYLKANDPQGGFRLHWYPKNGVEPDNNQEQPLDLFAATYKDMQRKGDKRRVVIEGNASGDENAAVGKQRADAVSRYLQSKGVKDADIIDVAGYGHSRPRAVDRKGNKFIEDKAKLNRYVHVRFVAAMDYGGSTADKEEEERKRIIGRELPPPGGDPDETLSKADVGRSLIMLIDEAIGGIIPGPVNVLIEPLMAWLNVLGAIDELHKTRARHAYRDGANMAAGFGHSQVYAGKSRIDYSEIAGRVTDARNDTKYTPLDPGNAEAAYGRGAVTISGGTYVHGKSTVTIDGVWNKAMEATEHQTMLSLYDQLRSQGRKTDEADVIYPKIIQDVRKHMANKLVAEIAKTLQNVR